MSFVVLQVVSVILSIIIAGAIASLMDAGFAYIPDGQGSLWRSPRVASRGASKGRVLRTTYILTLPDGLAVWHPFQKRDAEAF